MELKDAVALALVAQDPRRSAETALGQVLLHLRASGACLFRLKDRRKLALFASRGVDQADLDRADEAWQDASESILAGNTYTDEQFALIPLASPVTGVLYVGARFRLVLSPRAFEALRRLEPLLLAAIEAREEPDDGASSIEAYLEATPPDQVERQQLTVLLRRHHWNISRVARVLGVTRVTIYQRMARFGVARAPALRGEP
jgi:DNA-binding NtrC family response regulator